METKYGSTCKANFKFPVHTMQCELPCSVIMHELLSNTCMELIYIFFNFKCYQY